MKYTWNSKKRKKEAKIFGTIAGIMFLGMLWATTYHIPLAILLCWLSGMSFLIAINERIRDSFEKLGVRDDRKRNHR